MKIFSNVKKLFSYNWPTLIKNVLPDKNKKIIDSESQKNIRIGAIIRIISVVVLQVSIIGIAVFAVLKVYGSLLGGELVSQAIGNVLRENALTYIFDIIKASIIPIAILVYNEIVKNKQQNSWVYFIILILALLQTLSSLFSLFSWFATFIVSPIFALIAIVSIGLNFLGNVSIAIGCIEFCKKEQSTTKTIGSYQPNVEKLNAQNQQQMQQINPAQQMQQINPTQQMQQINPTQQMQQINPAQQMQQPMKICSNCGNKVSSTSPFCLMCGEKF